MAKSSIQASKNSLFFLLLGLSILIYIVPQKATNTLNFLFKEIFSPFLKVGMQFANSNIRMSEPADETFSKEEYDQLWKNYKNLRAQVTELEEQVKSLTRLRKTIGLIEEGFLPARISTLQRGVRHELTLNRGSSDGAAAGQFVLSPQKNSVIGIVRETSESMSRVQLLTDSACVVEIRIRRDNEKLDIAAQMIGDGRSGCKITLMPRDTDIRVGDTIYAAPSTAKLSIPIVIGEVRQVKPDLQNPVLWDIYVEPVENVTKLTEVVIIIPDTK